MLLTLPLHGCLGMVPAPSDPSESGEAGQGPVAAGGTDGSSTPTVLLGQSAPLSGPSARLGEDYRAGAMAWFEEVNRRGGIHGRPIRLLSLDDGYEPERTVRNTRRLIEGDRAFALFGYVGTPTVKAALPLVEQEGIPLVAPLTGASLLRTPLRPMVFNLRASYGSEIDQMVDHLVRAGRHRIAVVHQSDAFGDDGLAAARRALARHGLKPVATASVRRNSTAVTAAAMAVKGAEANGVVVVTSYPTSAAFSRELASMRSRAQLMNVSFVGTRALQEALPQGRSHGIGVAQVVPFPWDRHLPVVVQYQRLMGRLQSRPRFSHTSLEGFLAARLMTEGLRRAGPRPTRQALIKGLQSIRDLDLGGFRIQLSPADHQASDLVELTFLGSQPWEP